MILPPGTQIVTRVPIAGTAHAYPPGSLAVITDPPVDASHAYRVRLPDGFEANLTRSQFALLSAVQKEGFQRAALADHDLADHVIYRCVVGSRAYGLQTAASDTDTRGIYLPPASRHWSLFGVPEQLENRATDEVYWELQKFLILALKANPNVLEVLYSPQVLAATPLARDLLAMRDCFVSKLIFQTYSGYVMSQFRRLQNRLHQEQPVKWKHAMHLIRLLLSGIEALRTAIVPLRVADEHRPTLLAIRAGEMDFEAIDRWRLQLQGEFESAFAATTLPDRPDYERANAFLIRARRAAAENDA